MGVEPLTTAMIAACLARYRQHCIEQDEQDRADRAAGKPLPPLQVLTIEDLMRERPLEERVANLLSDPLRSALRGKVREYGWRIWIEGGLDAMQKASDAVEDLCPGFANFAGATLDKWWDGIGHFEKPGGMWIA